MTRRTTNFVELGDRFGNRTVIATGVHIGVHRAAIVRCDCGGEQPVRIAHLKRGIAQRCLPCFNGSRDRARDRFLKFVRNL